MTKQVLTVGLTYTGDPIPGVEIENLGLCQPSVAKKYAAFPLYEYDTIIINPASFTHFLFGQEGKHSDEPYELGKLKSEKDAYDIDTAFDFEDRKNEMKAAIKSGANVVWCLFLSHTGLDKPFVRRLRDDLRAHGVPRVWVDEAEIEIGDSLIAKIEEGMKVCRFIGVVLSTKSIEAPWVKKELDVAMNREIAGGEVVVLPLLYESCDLPEFLKGKLYADFTDPDTYEDVLGKLLRRLRIR